MRFRFLSATIAAFPLLLTGPTYGQGLSALKDSTEKWIQSRNSISKEKSEWALEKQLLQSSIETLESTKENLENNVQILELQSSELEEQITQAKEQTTSYDESNAYILSKVSEYEERTKDIFKRLPNPLKEKLSPLIRKIPDSESSDPPVQNRLQNVVAISSIVDEFNNNLTLTHTIKTLKDGESIEVRVLYWGLAGAYACNADGSQVWTLRPAEPEWIWSEQQQYSSSIKKLFDVYDKTTDPVLVAVPFELDQGRDAN